MGFDGKTLIHPSQLEPCNRLFAPSEAEVDQAREIIEAFEAATAEGKGVVTVNGRMIENLHVDNARRVLARRRRHRRPVLADPAYRFWYADGGDGRTAQVRGWVG